MGNLDWKHYRLWLMNRPILQRCRNFNLKGTLKSLIYLKRLLMRTHSATWDTVSDEISATGMLPPSFCISLNSLTHSIVSGVKQTENIIGFFMHRKCRLQLIQNNIRGHIPHKLVLVPLYRHFQYNKAV